MDPQPTYPPAQPSRKKRVYLLVGVVMLALLAITFWRVRNGLEARELTSTNLRLTDNFGHVSGSSLYFYNGLAFQKTELQTGDNQTLSSGLKLPQPSQIHWAQSEGALLNFSSSFYASEVDRISKASGNRLSQEDVDDTWYLDFSTNELSLVDKAPVSQGLAYYSASEEGFYYIVFSKNEMLLKFYNTSSKEASVVVDNLDLIDVSHLGGCVGYQVCLIARNATDAATARLYGVNNAEVAELHNSHGRLFATSRDNQFVSTTNSEAIEGPRGKAFDEEIDFGNTPALLYTIGQQELAELGFLIGESDLVLGFGSDDEFFMLDNSTETDISPTSKGYVAGKVSGKSSLLKLVYATGEPFDGGFIAKASFADGGVALLATTQGDQLLFSTVNSVYEFSALGSDEALASANNCVGDSTGRFVDYFSSDSTFKIYLPFDSDFYAKISSFSNCLTQTNTTGYNYHFVGTDPVSGRIVTD